MLTATGGRPEDPAGTESTATSVSYWAFYQSTTTTPVLAGVGRYDDTWRLTGTGWKLAHRRITLG